MKCKHPILTKTRNFKYATILCTRFKALRGSPKGKAQRGQYLLAVYWAITLEPQEEVKDIPQASERTVSRHQELEWAEGEQ